MNYMPLNQNGRNNSIITQRDFWPEMFITFGNFGLFSAILISIIVFFAFYIIYGLNAIYLSVTGVIIFIFIVTLMLSFTNYLKIALAMMFLETFILIALSVLAFLFNFNGSNVDILHYSDID